VHEQRVLNQDDYLSTREDPLELAGLIQWVSGVPGPRLLILNTVQSAAAIARELGEKRSRVKVEHLSTALAPYDRKVILDRVKSRLEDPSDNDWTLVATSCVEAGRRPVLSNLFQEAL